MRILTELLKIWPQSELSRVLADVLADIQSEVCQLELFTEYEVVHCGLLVDILHQCCLQSITDIFNLNIIYVPDIGQ